MATSFTVRQFYTIPSEYGTFTAPSGIFVVTGSISRLLVNNTRTNLAADSMTITTEISSPYVANSATSQGWWPGPNTDGEVGSYGIIVGGSETFTNTGAGSVGTSEVSCWGFPQEGLNGGENQEQLDELFIALASSVLGVTYGTVANAKTALRTAGYYYQYPVGFDGQNPNTGNGSD